MFTCLAQQKSLLFLLLFIFLIGPLSGQNVELSKSEKKVFKTGKKYLKQGEDTKAIASFLEVYKSASSNTDNLYFITITYNDRLEDYTNAYKYGNILLEVLDIELKNLNYEDDKREYTKTKDLIDEIELLVLVAKPKAKIAESEADDNSDIEQTSDEILKEQDGDLNKKSNTQNDSEIDLRSSSTTIDQNSSLFLGFNTIYSSVDNVKQEIVSSVTNEHNKIKGNSSLYQKKYSKVLNDNLNWQTSYTNSNLEYFENLKKCESELMSAIYEYNISLFQRDSIGQIIALLNNRNRSLNEELASLNWYLDQFNYADQDSLVKDEPFKLKERIFIGRYKYMDLSDEKLDRILDDLILSVQENTDFSYPVINGVVSFLNSFHDDNYLYLICKITDTDESVSGKSHFTDGGNLEVHSYQSGQLVNIKSSDKFSFFDLGLQENEIKIIQDMSKNVDKYLTDFYQYSRPNMSSSDLTFFAEKRLSIILEELKGIQTSIDNYKALINNSLNTYQYKYFSQKEDYESKINEYSSFVNYLVIHKERIEKSSLVQFSEMAGEIVDIAFNNLNTYQIKLSRIITYSDTSNRIMQIKFLRDTILLKPDLDQYKILTLSKLSFDDSNDTYFAIDMGFKLNYSFPDNVSINTTDTQGQIQANDPYSNTYEDTYGVTSDNSDEDDNYIPSGTGVPEIIIIDGLPVLTDQYGKRWKVLEDNPSSYTSYMMFQEEEGWRLPTYNELKSIILYVTSSKNKREQLGWADNGVIYLSGDSHYDNRNNELFKGIKLTGSSYQNQNVQGGAEVYLIVISE